MAENVSLNSVSSRMLSDMKSAFSSYAQNKNAFENQYDSKEAKMYNNRGQITRQAYFDMQSTFPKNTQIENKEEDANDRVLQDAANTSIQANDIQNKQPEIKAEIKEYTLPKNNDTIIAELKRNGMHRTMTAYQIAEEYNVSYMKAREILDEVNKDANGFVVEYNLPENSTLSFKV